MWLVAGGRLSQYCSWMEAATGLSQRRNTCVGRNQMAAGLYTQYAAPLCLLGCGSKLVRSELAYVLMDVTPKSAWWTCTSLWDWFPSLGLGDYCSLLCFPPIIHLLPQTSSPATHAAALHSPCQASELLLFSILTNIFSFSIFAS